MAPFGASRAGLMSTRVDAIPDSVVLQPASDDLNNFDGDTGEFDIDSTAPVFDGSLSLKAGQGSTSINIIGSAAGLQNYPQVGKRHSFFANLNNDSGSEDALIFVNWGHSNTTARADGYGLLISADSGELQLRRYDDGADTILDSDSTPTYPTNAFLAFEVLHEADGSLTLQCYDASDQDASTYREGDLLTTLTATDSTHITDGEYDNNGILFLSTRNTGEVYDLWRTE